MKLISNDTDLRGMDCHTHSTFSLDARQTPDDIVKAARERGLRGFIITDHLDIGHWRSNPDLDEYFRVWNAVRERNPDLNIIIGLEVGCDARYIADTYEYIKNYPFEYLINSVHYMFKSDPDNKIDHYALGKRNAYTEYIETVLDSLDTPWEFNTIGHFGFVERYAPPPMSDWEMRYDEFAPLMDKLIQKAVSRGVRFELNTNSCGAPVLRLPRAEFLTAYKAAGGIRPVTSSDAHASPDVARDFARAEDMIAKIFDK